MYVHLPIYVQERFARASRNGAYGAAVETVDWVTAVILHELRTRGLDESTIVIFTSDNGSRGRDGGSNAPLRGAKGTTWEGGMRVPCIVRWPGRIARRAARATSCRRRSTCSRRSPRCAAPSCRTTAPSTASTCRTVLLDDAAPSPRDAFWYYRMNDLEAVRAGCWKLHIAKAGTPVHELYDVVADPAESTDRAAEQPAEVARLDAPSPTTPAARSATPALGIVGCRSSARSGASPTRAR